MFILCTTCWKKKMNLKKFITVQVTKIREGQNLFLYNIFVIFGKNESTRINECIFLLNQHYFQMNYPNMPISSYEDWSNPNKKI